ncbi:MFS transporter [Agrilactobacillus yilanensis]|uniref:MFS transporter n=1 Tax=Agrilactobacillus yilanensis TaxID=2485997 RepID=A0ABW4JAK2_9LACO|nr:MFS transporter [Agrilactobacillus yilanensis]
MTEAKTKTPIWLYAIAVFITQMDGGAVSSLLPAITRSFQLSSISASWVAGLYTLGLVIGTPIAANLSDLYGTKKVFLAELILWFIGSLITFTAPNYYVMLGGRLVQALGDGGIIVLSINAVLAVAKQKQQGRKVSIIGVIAGLSAIFGPIIAGISIGISGSWRLFYGLMLPVLVILLLLAWRFLDNTPGQPGKKTDYLGIITFTIALSSLMLALTFAQHFNTYAFLILILLVVGLISGELFIRFERRLDQNHLSFLPLHLLKKPAYTLTILLGALGGMLFSVFVYIPTFVHTTFGLPIRLSGMVLVGTGVGSILGSYLGGVLVDKRGIRSALLWSSLVIGSSSLLIALTLSSLRMFMIFSFIFGIGLGGLMSAPLQVIAGRLADPSDHAQAIGGLSTMKKIGVTIAPLLFATVLQLSAKDGVMGLASYRNMFIVIIFIAVACAIVTVKMPLERSLKERVY